MNLGGVEIWCFWQGKMKSGITHLERVAKLKEPGDPKSKEHYFEALLLLSRYYFYSRTEVSQIESLGNR